MTENGVARLAVSLKLITEWLHLQEIGIEVIWVEKSIDDIVYLIISCDKLPRRRDDGGLRIVTLTLTKTDASLKPEIHV